MATIIAIANQKGGVGKSQTTLMLAAALAQHFKKKVLVCDTDKQQSIFTMRQQDMRVYGEDAPKDFFDVMPMNASEFIKSLPMLSKNYDVIFADVAGKLDNDVPVELQDVTPVLTWCDYVIIPFVAGNHNTRSASEFFNFVERIRKAKAKHPTLSARPLEIGIFVNRLESGASRKRMFKDIETLRNAYPHVIVMDAPIKNMETFKTADTFTSNYDPSKNGAIGNFTAFVNDFLIKFDI